METLSYFNVPDRLWQTIEPLLAPFIRTCPGGSPSISFYKIFSGILYRLKTGCQWSMIPREYGAKSTIHEHFQRWVGAGVFKLMTTLIAAEYEEKNGFKTEWQAMDGTLVQAPVRKKADPKEGLGANPTDRGRSGTKIHLHVDGEGTPMGICGVGANTHDSRLVGPTLENTFAFSEQAGTGPKPDNLCLDKGYDYARVKLEVAEHGLEGHIRSRGEEIAEKLYPARRWVVERTIAWLKGFRALRTRYCQYLRSYLAFVYFACTIIIYRKIADETCKK